MDRHDRSNEHEGRSCCASKCAHGQGTRRPNIEGAVLRTRCNAMADLAGGDQGVPRQRGEAAITHPVGGRDQTGMNALRPAPANRVRRSVRPSSNSIGSQLLVLLGSFLARSPEMAKRKKSVRTPVKRHSASKPRKRTADVDLKKYTSRLKRELKQAREARFREAQQSVDYQTATADVLSVISRSTRDVQPVFDAI